MGIGKFLLVLLTSVLILAVSQKITDSLPLSNPSPELYCINDSDCTSYNTTDCCGWEAVNKNTYLPKLQYLKSVLGLVRKKSSVLRTHVCIKVSNVEHCNILGDSIQ